MFPHRPLDIAVLEAALEKQPADARAWMYLGNALFYLRRYTEANQAWERSLALMEAAFAADPSDARIFLELGHFLDAAGQGSRHAALLAKHEPLLLANEELVQRYSRVLLRNRQYEKAAAVIGKTRFFARERRSLIPGAYAEAHYGVGEALLAAGKPAEAMKSFRKALEYPDNLACGAPARSVLARFHYLVGLAITASGEADQTRQEWLKAVAQTAKPTSEAVVYQALALRKLGREQEAEARLKRLIEACRSAARTGDRDAAVTKYVLSRAFDALGKSAEAEAFLREAMRSNPDAVLDARIEAERSPALPGS